jgi:hypothetical protein
LLRAQKLQTINRIRDFEAPFRHFLEFRNMEQQNLLEFETFEAELGTNKIQIPIEPVLENPIIENLKTSKRIIAFNFYDEDLIGDDEE